MTQDSRNPGHSDTARTFGYARVSTDDQSLAMQIAALEKAGCDKIFMEKKSAAAPYRRQFNLLIKSLREGDTLIVWKLDRLGRDVMGLGKLIQKFEADGVQFKSLTESIDTSTPIGKAFFYLIAVLAELERNLTRERTKAGIAIAQARGVQFGRPTKIVGEKREEILRDIQDVSVPLREVAAKHGYSAATLHKHFPGERGKAIQKQAKT